ncbi:lipopolysaccharide biosynthesis protein [Sporolactobacillus kofuensis]|uniref:Lipopolysaccharide biosynthesis protein n=1 Tax=Sporolactobacillus kofuensis TaxID=269672 RepID=A0ABW1WJ90_9BACL|nr:polysaccharide biosynthesis C-terminal domain-containing protein [Sporolactobacillus kofuensis]MCO7177102.1 polysaccharide biosynthesis C-terminal domain-containing protein [Sporolactobacillus kofuensis]
MMKIRQLNGNTKKVIYNVVNGMGVKGIAIIIGFFTIPAYMRYFSDNAILGVWFTILSVLNWILNFDLGIGNGVRNRLVVTIANNDEKGTRKYISSAYIFLTAISFSLFCVVYVVSQIIPWNTIFNIPEQKINSSALKAAIIIVLLGILLQFVLRLISSILYALQESFMPSLLMLIANIILLIFVTISNISRNNNNIIMLALVYLFAVNVPLLIATIVIFSTRLKKVKPSKRFFDIKYAIDTLKLGSVFLGLQLEAMVLNNTSIFFISWLLGSIHVVEYNVYFKIFSLVSTVYALITVPIWSAITKAKSENDYQWILKTIRALQIIAVIFTISQFLMFPIMQLLFDVWLGENSFDVNYLTMFLFAVEQGIMIWSGIYASICSGLNEMKWQFVWMTVGACLMIPLTILFTNIFYGYYGVILAHCISLLPYCVGQTVWLERFIRKGEKR